MDNVESAKWIKSNNIANQFLAALDVPTCFKQWSYPIMVPFLPISLDIEDPEWIHAVEVENNLKRGDIEGARWIKQRKRCSSHQWVAHTIFTLANMYIENTLLWDGLYVQKEKLNLKKDKDKPIWCAKCQEYGHLACHCKHDSDMCAQCSLKHRTDQCT